MARNVQLGRRKPRSAISNTLVASWSARVALSGRPRATSMTPLTKLQVPRGNSAFSSNAVAYPTSAWTCASPSSPLSIRAHDRVSWKYSSIVGNSSVHCGAVARCSSAIATARSRCPAVAFSITAASAAVGTTVATASASPCIPWPLLTTIAARPPSRTARAPGSRTCSSVSLSTRSASASRPNWWLNTPASSVAIAARRRSGPASARVPRNASSASSARFWSLSAAPSTYAASISGPASSAAARQPLGDDRLPKP